MVDVLSDFYFLCVVYRLTMMPSYLHVLLQLASRLKSRGCTNVPLVCEKPSYISYNLDLGMYASYQCAALASYCFSSAVAADEAIKRTGPDGARYQVNEFWSKGGTRNFMMPTFCILS